MLSDLLSGFIMAFGHITALGRLIMAFGHITALGRMHVPRSSAPLAGQIQISALLEVKLPSKKNGSLPLFWVKIKITHNPNQKV